MNFTRVLTLSAVLAALLPVSSMASSHFTGNPLQIPPTINGGTLTIRQQALSIWPGFTSNNLVTVNGGIPGPTLRLSRGQNFTATVANQLSEPFIMHWHGILSPGGQADGHPANAVGAGQSYSVSFPVWQQAGTYWYHAHTDMLTGKQAYMGAAGMFIVDDPAEAALGLPSGDHDLPLLLADKRPTATKQLTYAPTMMEVMSGYFGTEILANGTPAAYHVVDQGLYRLRLINASNARIFKIGLSSGAAFQLIANDAGLLDAPITLSQFWLPPGSRAEIVVNFATVPVGGNVALRSLTFPATGMVMPGAPAQGTQMDAVKFYVERAATGSGTVPAMLRHNMPPPESASQRTRNFVLDAAPMVMGQPMEHWINGKVFNAAAVEFTVNSGEVETWSVQNVSDEGHPFHVHGVHFRVLQRVGAAAVPAEDTGWKDTVLVNAGETVRLLVRFDLAEGEYVLHCHNLEHEDSGMMMSFAVRPTAQPVIQTQSSTVVISWPQAVSTYTLETSSTMAPASWLPVSGSPTLAAGLWQHSAPVTSGRAFFRLSSER